MSECLFCKKKLTGRQLKFCSVEHNYKHVYKKNKDDPEFKAKRKERMNDWYERNRDTHIAKVKLAQRKRWLKFKKIEELKE